jgi:hypothetical protein
MLTSTTQNLITTLAESFTPAYAPPCAESALLRAYPRLIATCSFDKTASAGIIAFEIVIILGWVASLFILPRFKDKLWQRYAVMILGVFIFEFFTSPMWNNHHMGPWAYVYQDVSWILTLGWSTLILSTVILVDHFFAQWREWQRFGLYLASLTILVMLAEMVVINLGLRSYAPEVQAVLVGYSLFNVPVEGLYYIPVFTALVISFYKYWSLVLDDEPVVPVRRRRWGATFLISVLGVFLFELMIEPMVVNAGFPAWSYIYRDISLLMTGLWVVVIWLCVYLVDRLLIQFSLVTRFLVYMGLIGIVVLPLEAWFINHGYRLYGPSATANFTGFTTVVADIPVEVAFAVPLYLALVIAFIRYWEINLGRQA